MKILSTASGWLHVTETSIPLFLLQLNSTNFGNCLFSSILGSRRLPYATTQDEEEVKGIKKLLTLHSISAMPSYKDKSHEELRFNDYEERAKAGVQAPWGKASEPSGAPVNILSHPQCSNPSPFTPFSTPPSTNNPFSPSTNPFALPATTPTQTPFTSPSPLSPQNSPFTIPSTNPSPFTFVPQSQTTTTPTPFTSPSPSFPQKSPFTTPTNPSPFTFLPQSQTITTPNPFTSPSPSFPQKSPFTTPTNPSPFTFVPQSQTTTTPNPFTSPSPSFPQKSPFTTPMNPSPFTFLPQSQTTTTLNPFTSPSPSFPQKSPFTIPTNPSPSTFPSAPHSQTTTTPSPFTSPSPSFPQKSPFTTTANPSPFTFLPQSQTTTTPNPFTSPSPLFPQKSPFTTPTNPSPFTFPSAPHSQTSTTTTTPTPFTSPSPLFPQKNSFTINPSPFTFPQSQTPTITIPFVPATTNTVKALGPSIPALNVSQPGQICPTVPSQGLSNLMEPTLVADPFGLRSAVNTSVIQSEAVTSTPRGISSLPVKNNSAPVRISSSYRVRHLSTRRASVPANRYNPENSGSKVPFFDDKESRPCLVDPILPRENPRAWVINKSYQHEHAPIATCKNGEACEDKAGTNSCLQENENSIKVNNDTSLQEKLRVADDPLVSSLMPKLPRGGEYYTEPSIKELEAKERAEPGFCTHVKNFVVGRKDKGSIKFLGETDIRCLNLESIVKFNDREVIVYEDDGKKPPVGQGLNRPAEITLLNVKHPGKTSEKLFSDGRKLEKMLRKKTNEQGAEFVSYNLVRGEWKFRVQHFEN